MGNNVPSYLGLLATGELNRRVEIGKGLLHQCRLCGRDCGLDRTVEIGPCLAGTEVLVATAYLHLGEEPPLVGESGSGAIFFSGCELQCKFCQTARWNIQGHGHRVTIRDLADVMLQLQSQGAANINLVTPTHFAPQILEALLLAAYDGLQLPLVWNSGGYDSLQALALLDGVVDIYLPDMKFSDAKLGKQLSGICDYPQVSQMAVKEMYRQVGNLAIDNDGVTRKGVLIRHLIMPGLSENTAGVLHWIAAHLGEGTYLGLMDQYRPAHQSFELENTNHQISQEEYLLARQLAKSMGLRCLNGGLRPD